MGIVARPLLIAFLLAAVISPALAKPPVTKGSKVETVPARSDLDDLASDSASLRASVSRAAQKMAAAQQPGPAAPIPKPDPVRAAKADHTVRITNMSEVVQRNYPLRFARPFICGEIAHYPQLLVNGAAAPTQADVKNRCPDGSVKFAIISAVIPSLPANGNVVLTFQDQPNGNNTAIAAADLLAQFPDFDAVIRISGAAVGAKTSVSARQMLADGACKPWTSGPVAQTMICADRSATRAYDIGSDQWRSLHPEFVVTFWPATKQVFVRYVGEISNTQALEAFTYNLELTAGKANPQSVYKQAGIQHSIATRWTRTAWLGGTGKLAGRTRTEDQHRPQYRLPRRHQLSAELRPLAENPRERACRRLQDLGDGRQEGRRCRAVDEGDVERLLSS